MPEPKNSSNTTVRSRTVNKLSDAQLERKRANDREAQRIIRKKTRDHIEDLERKVTDKEEQLEKALLRISQLEAQVAAQQADIARMTTDFRYWRIHGVGGRNDTGSTGSWHPHPLPLLTPGILTGHRPKCGTRTPRFFSSCITRMYGIKPHIRADARTELIWNAANRFNLLSL